ncbi:hypothetical protein RCO48_31065 [Peribacillus frigoritolerans]|nr:hypothetical protein [Peribacillus frigoritolerans]
MEAIVIGEQDDRLGQIVSAYIVSKKRKRLQHKS